MFTDFRFYDGLFFETFTSTPPNRTDFILFFSGVVPVMNASAVSGCETGDNFSSCTIRSVLLAYPVYTQYDRKRRIYSGGFTVATRSTMVFLPSHVTHHTFTNESISTVLLSQPQKFTLGPTHLSNFFARLRRMALELAPESTNATTSPMPSIDTLITGRGTLWGDLRYPVRIGPAPSGNVTFLEMDSP